MVGQFWGENEKKQIDFGKKEIYALGGWNLFSRGDTPLKEFGE